MEFRLREITPLSMVTREGLQRILVSFESPGAAHLLLEARREGRPYRGPAPFVCPGGAGEAAALLPAPEESFEAEWIVRDKTGREIARARSRWEKPREWTWYVMLSSHMDIGLHNSQYEQRYDCSRTMKKAMEFCDGTANEAPMDQYRFTAEGTWFWNSFCADQGEEAARKTVQDYVKTGKIGVCAGVAGNLAERYGLEEMCRSAYEKKRLEDTWGVRSETIAMIDMNGMPHSMIQPCAEAGYRNVIFAPNQWNPLPSRVWPRDYLSGYDFHCPEAGGGGSRVDVRYASGLPMVFFWENGRGDRLLVWSSAQYGHGGEPFGIFIAKDADGDTVPRMEQYISRQARLMDEKYPWPVWLLACYTDNYDFEKYPERSIDRKVYDILRLWNGTWKWPHFAALGDPDVPFDILRRDWEDRIPVLRGDITAGWYQLPASAAEVQTEKFEADRLLPAAEKWASAAALVDGAYSYPAVEFRRAWDHLLFEDEHSYGASGYKGRRVYETWLQHRDWISKALETGRRECGLALRTVASHIPSEGEKTVVFNASARDRTECVLSEDGKKYALAEVPAMGYVALSDGDFKDRDPVTKAAGAGTVLENRYYKITFKENGALSSVYDRELKRELLDPECGYGLGEIVYTRDNHESFLTPGPAEIRVTGSEDRITAEIRTKLDLLGAEILQTVTLPAWEKRIGLETRILHAKDMVNSDRYRRYLYCAFPFLVPGARRYCHMNGCVAEYAKTVTGHGTDVYMAVNEWCCSENGAFGAAVFTPDAQLAEYDHIHPDKTDFGDAGEGSQIYMYLANDWLQRHVSGGSHLDFRFRFSVTSYEGTYAEAKVPEAAERFGDPVRTVRIGRQEGDLDPLRESFLRLEDGRRLLTLKRAEDGRGLIARVYGQMGKTSFGGRFGKALSAERNTVDETEWKEDAPEEGFGFSTWRLGRDAVSLRTGERDLPKREDGRPSPVGSVYTGLVSEPRACAGAGSGEIYLLWGESAGEEDIACYRVYRSEEEGFEPGPETLIAEVAPQKKYVVARYTDGGLKADTRYFYRVSAVSGAGVEGPVSRECWAYTQETDERMSD